MTTDFRALCAELVEELENWIAYGDEIDIANAHVMVDRARAALAQSEPPADGEVAELVAVLRQISLAWEPDACLLGNMTAGQLTRTADLLERLSEGPAVQSREPASVVEQPSDEELESFLVDVAAQSGDIYWADPRVLARAVLAGWGTSNLTETRSSLEPIPVSERLPEAGDCDAEGRCWMYSKVEAEWRLINAANPGVPHLKYCFSHWLPAHALPLPSAEVES